ncbi:hypothetical protein H2203_003648 [Taxawa tesnikishii (nom. ined.)]|nr:hypothetical protein H2203_003648 [Dothideales sp. JES 119]
MHQPRPHPAPPTSADPIDTEAFGLTSSTDEVASIGSNVTFAARSAFLQNNSIVIGTSNLPALFSGDPCSGNTKSLSLLDTYNDELRTYVTTDDFYVQTINSGPAVELSEVPPLYAPSSGSTSTIQILVVLWGNGTIDTQTV